MPLLIPQSSSLLDPSAKGSGREYGMRRSYYFHSERSVKNEGFPTLNGAFPNISTQSTSHTIRPYVGIPSLARNDLITPRMQMSEILSLAKTGHRTNGVNFADGVGDF